MNDLQIKKNLLDLEHSENLSKGITEISIASGGFITISFSLFNKNLIGALIMGLAFSTIFLVDGIRKLDECKKIRDEIKLMIRV